MKPGSELLTFEMARDLLTLMLAEGEARAILDRTSGLPLWLASQHASHETLQKAFHKAIQLARELGDEYFILRPRDYGPGTGYEGGPMARWCL